MQQGFRKPGDGSGGQLVSLCLSGHGAEHSGFCPAWCGDRRVARAARVGWTCCALLLDPSRAGVTLQCQPEALRGCRGDAVAAAQWTALAAQYLKGISACREAALTPFGAGASSPARETPWEQLKGFVKGLPHILPACGQGLCARGCLGWGAQGVSPCTSGVLAQRAKSSLKSCTSAWELQSGLNPSWGICRNSGNALFSGFKRVM